MNGLAREHPQEYPKGAPTLDDDEVDQLLTQIGAWERDGNALVRTFKFKNFNEAFGFVTRVALLAEAESHHPAIHNSWNEVELRFWTHTASGLTRNDFIMAAKIDAFAP